jgi:hypothetical protein
VSATGAFRHRACVYGSDPFAGLRPARLEPSAGDGLWLANQVCDRMEIRSGADGSTIQLQVPSRHDQEMAAQPGFGYRG